MIVVLQYARLALYSTQYSCTAVLGYEILDPNELAFTNWPLQIGLYKLGVTNWPLQIGLPHVTECDHIPSHGEGQFVKANL